MARHDDAPGLLSRLATRTRQLGLGLIGLGLVSAIAPAVSGGAVVLVVGLVLVLAGLAGLVFGWRAWSAGKGAFALVAGGVGTAAGLALVLNPVSSFSAVTTLVALYFVASGVAELLFGQRLGAADGQGWVVGDALLSIALGALMWAEWPVSGERALGLLVGVKLASAGAVMVRLERALGRGVSRLSQVRERLGAGRDDPS